MNTFYNIIHLSIIPEFTPNGQSHHLAMQDNFVKTDCEEKL